MQQNKLNTQSPYPKIKLKRGKEESLERFHPWVFSGAVCETDTMPAEGEIVEVVTHNGDTVGIGHYQIGSIAVRMLEFGVDRLSDDYFRRRIGEAYLMRRALGLIREDNDSYRLVHGEGDLLPGLVIDVYGDTAVIQAHSPGMHYIREEIADVLISLPDAGIKNVYYKSETTLPYMARLNPEDGYLAGKAGNCVAVENGLKFHIDWLKGQKTGFFLDQRDNRALVERYAKGRNVLNMFCYTGGFSVYAMRGDAASVCSIDSSAKAIMLTEKNVELNFGAVARHKALACDAFKYLDETQNDEYDLIILDPPAFAKHRNAVKNGLNGYRKLNAKAFEKIRSGGILFTFSCSQVVTKDMFRHAVFTAAARSGRNVRILHQLTQPADHPVNIYHPEGEYLKGLVLYVE